MESLLDRLRRHELRLIAPMGGVLLDGQGNIGGTILNLLNPYALLVGLTTVFMLAFAMDLVDLLAGREIGRTPKEGEPARVE